MMDYATEINRLFARNNDNNAYFQPPPQSAQYPPSFYQTPVFQTMANTSSSDSNSPATPPSFGNRSSSSEPQRRPETPQIKRHRPIVGRKIIDNEPEQRRFTEPRFPSSDFNVPIQNWDFHAQNLDFHRPNLEFGTRNLEFGTRNLEFRTRNMEFGTHNMDFGTRNMEFGTQDMEFGTGNWDYNQNNMMDSFELFPSERQYRTPIKKQPHTNTGEFSNYELFPQREYRTPVKTQATPNASPSSPHSNFAFSPSYAACLSDSPNTRNYPPNAALSRTPPGLFPPSPPQRLPADATGTKLCTFCRKNGETPMVYTSHMLKERGGAGARSVVTCPILRSHRCDTCGASGDNAHTKTYCPVQRRGNNGLPLQSTTIILKNTRLKSNGRRRY